MENSAPKDTVRKGLSAAEKELKERQIKTVKEIALKTLERIEAAKKLREEANTTIRILQKDLEDLKAGRLDRIEERQKKDAKAKEVSVVFVDRVAAVKEETHYIINTSRWYEPWRITYNPCYSIGYTGSATNFELTNSISADYISGAYTMPNGAVIHI